MAFFLLLDSDGVSRIRFFLGSTKRGFVLVSSLREDRSSILNDGKPEVSRLLDDDDEEGDEAEIEGDAL